MVGSIRPTVNGRPSPRQDKQLAEAMVAEGEAAQGGGDGLWIQPTAEKDVIVSPHMTIDPQVLRNMVKQTNTAQSESDPKLSGNKKKMSTRTLQETKSTLPISQSKESAMRSFSSNKDATSSNKKSALIEPQIESSLCNSGTTKKKSTLPVSADKLAKVVEKSDMKYEKSSNWNSEKKSENNIIADASCAANVNEREASQKIANKNGEATLGALGYKRDITDLNDTDLKQEAIETDNKFEVSVFNGNKETNASPSGTNGAVPKVNLTVNAKSKDLNKRPTTSLAPQINLNSASADTTDNVPQRPRRPVDLQMNHDVCEEICASAPNVLDQSENYFTTDYCYPPGVQRDTAALGRDLYLRFLHEEMRTVHVREPPCMDPWRAARLDLDYSQSLNSSVRIRKSLRQVADAFSCSEHRARVREQAAQVNIESLDYKSFQNMLYTLFQEGGMTSERVIVLFYFCADLTIRALNEHMTSYFHQLIEWSQLYIVDTLSMWVQQNGGWSAVLEQSANFVYTAAKFSLVCASVVALCIFIRRG